MPNPTNPNEAEDAERELKKLVYDYFNDDLLLVCDRVWEAWHVGTMTEDDFSRIDEDDYVLPELVRRLSAFVEAQKQKWVEEYQKEIPNLKIYDGTESEPTKFYNQGFNEACAAWRAALRGESK